MSKGALTLGSIAWSEPEFSYSPCILFAPVFCGSESCGSGNHGHQSGNSFFVVRERQRWTKQNNR